MDELRRIIHQLTLPGTLPAVLATLVNVSGSSYRRPGARLLVTTSGQRIGSISGGCLEEDLIERARRVRASGQPEVVVYDTTDENDLVWGVGIGCNGIVHVLLERLDAPPAWALAVQTRAAQRLSTALAVFFGPGHEPNWGTHLAHAATGDGAAPETVGPADAGIFRELAKPPLPLVICGAGDDAQPLSRLAKELGWHVTVVDPRAAFATRERFPLADAVLVSAPRDLARHVPLDEQTVAVVMTHHYVHDVPLLRALLPAGVAYLGLLGPKKRADKILADLAAQGLALTPAQRARLHAPVGLDLGGDAPEVVALAIVAEIQATLSGRGGRPLRERTRPIHE